MEALAILLMILAVIGVFVMPIVMLVSLSGLKQRVADMEGAMRRLSSNVVAAIHSMDGSTARDEAAGVEPAVGVVVPVVAPQGADEHKEQPVEPLPAAAAARATPPPVPPGTPAPLRGMGGISPRPAGAASAHAPTKPIEPKPPSKFAQAVSSILREGWNWLLVNEKYRPSGVTAEYAIATTWMTRVGVVVLVGGIAFLLQWSIENGWLGKEARTAMSMLAGVVAIVAGTRLVGRKYHLLALGFLGGGIVTLYLSAYAACPRYHILPVYAAFGLMILITVAAGYLAVRTDSVLVAILGLIGGYLTPVALSTGTGNLAMLYSYMIILSLGILALAQYRQWRLLNYLALIFTYVLIVFSLDRYYKISKFSLAMPLITILFVIHSSVTFLQSLIRGRRTTVLEVIHLVVNSVAYAFIGYFLIRDAHGRPYPAVLSVGLCAFYVGHVALFLRRKLQDRSMLTAVLGLAGMYLVWTLPLVFEKETLTIGLALVALMFLWLGARMNSNFLRNLAHALYAVVFFRLLVLDVGRNYSFRPAVAPMSDYWKGLLDRLWTFGTAIASVFAGFFLQQRGAGAVPAMEVREVNDTPLYGTNRLTSTFFYWFGLLFAFLVLHFELNSMFAYWRPLRMPVLTLLWCGMAAYFIWRYVRVGIAPANVMLVAACAFVFGSVLKLFVFDLREWNFCDGLYYNIDYTALYAAMRFLDFGFLLALVFGAWYVFARRSGDDGAPAAAFGYGGLLLLFIYLSLELNSLLHWKVRDFQEGGISVLWALFAIAFIAGGVWKNVRPLRYVGLILFSVVVAKVCFYDLSGMKIAFRIIAFMAVGAMLLLGSFAYMYANRKFTSEDGA